MNENYIAGDVLIDSLLFCLFVSFVYSRTHSMNRVDKTESYLGSLPLAHQNMMLKYRDHLFRIRNCIGKCK